MTSDDTEDTTTQSRLYFEDLNVDDRFAFGSCTVTSEMIREFAERYDPQWFHLDASAATDSLFGDLVASGWHTVCVSNRMLIDDVFGDVAVMGGSGVRDLRWPAPVRPGDTLSGTATVADTATGKHDDRGYVTINTVVDDQDEGTVLTMTSTLLVRRRETPENE